MVGATLFVVFVNNFFQSGLLGQEVGLVGEKCRAAAVVVWLVALGGAAPMSIVPVAPHVPKFAPLATLAQALLNSNVLPTSHERLRLLLTCVLVHIPPGAHLCALFVGRAFVHVAHKKGVVGK